MLLHPIKCRLDWRVVVELMVPSEPVTFRRTVQCCCRCLPSVCRPAAAITSRNPNVVSVFVSPLLRTIRPSRKRTWPRPSSRTKWRRAWCRLTWRSNSDQQTLPRPNCPVHCPRTSDVSRPASSCDTRPCPSCSYSNLHADAVHNTKRTECSSGRGAAGTCRPNS